jgi:hypothetical protein
MKARFALACAAAGIAASTFAGTASAGDFSEEIRFRSEVVEPGHDLDITGTCSDPNFTAPTLSSSILDVVDISIVDGNEGRLMHARTKVKPDAAPGVWPVSFKCGTKTVTGNLRVVAAELPPLRPAISIDPNKGLPGTKVEIYVVCTEVRPVTSAALAIGSVTELPGGGEGQPYFEVTGKVKNVKPGTYKVSSTCAGKPISTTFTVLASEPVKGQVPVKPKKAPETGDA